MIDLNHLLKNIDIYKDRYNHKQLKVNLDAIVSLEDKRKELQLKTEAMRSLCNKLCGEVPAFRAKNKNTSELISQITMLDEQIKVNNKKLESYGKKINKKLSKLHNLPEFLNKYNEQMTTTSTNTTLVDLKKLIHDKYEVVDFNKKILNYMNEKKSVLFEENNLPTTMKCSDGYLFLCTKEQVKEIKEFFLDYFKHNALSLIKVSCRKLNKANTSSFYVHLNKREAFYFEINEEFYTRKFNLKYKNSKIDMTKFLNQINILFKW